MIGARCFITAAAATCASSALLWMQPLLFQTLVTSRGLSESSAGLVLTVEVGAMAAAAALFARWVPREQAQCLALLGVAVAAIASFVSLYAQSFWPFVVVRTIVGIGLGGSIMIANVIAANFSDPSKMYAWLGWVNLTFGAAIIPAFPLTVALFPTATPYTTLFGTLVLLLPLMAVLPRFSAFDRAGMAQRLLDIERVNPRAVRLHTYLLVATTFMIMTGSGMVWSFYAIIGQQAGLSDQSVNTAISVSIITSFIGMTAPAIVGSRFGRIAPFCVSLTLMVGAILVLTSHPSPTAFRIAVCVNVAAIYLILPYLSGAAIALDNGGKAASYVVSAFFFGNAAAPFIGGSLAATTGLELVGKLMLLMSILAAGMFIYVERRHPVYVRLASLESIRH